jgi:hypothetical protein
MDEFKQCVSPYSKYEVNKNGIIRNFSTKHIKKSREDKGYLVISLVSDLVIEGIYKVNVVRVHKIVLLNFIGETPSDKHTIDHINGIKTDNTLNNLRWATPKEQANNRKQCKNSKTGGSTKVVLQYDMNNNFIKEFKNPLEVTLKLGINKTNLSANCLGKAKSTGGFIFKYKNEIKFEDEIWKDYTFNNKQILVSTYGRIKSNNRLLKGCISSQLGYIIVSISNNKVRKNELVHRLVAKCFLDNPDNKEIVNHKDQNKENNHIDNLEWCTRSENAIHFYKGTGAKLCKKIQQLDKNKNVIKIFDSLADAAKSINIKNKSQITVRIKNEKLYHGFYWKYLV